MLASILILQKCLQLHTETQGRVHYTEYLHKGNDTRKLFRSYLDIGGNITIHHYSTNYVHYHSQDKVHDDAIPK